MTFGRTPGTRAPLIAALALCIALPAVANDAEIILLIGKGDSRETAEAQWRPAAIKQKLNAGSFVRTGEMSQMGLLLRDRTQIRLSQLTILNIKGVATAAPPPPTQLELPQGRAWSQSKPKPGAPVAGAKPPVLEVSLPAAVALVRGTDWELVADKDGTSTVTVLSGEIEFFNAHGRVSVLPNEQARAVPGKAPVKILLTQAADRVQWVTAYRPHPRRWVRDLSDGLEEPVKRIEEGDFPPAMQALTRLTKDPRASVLLADLQLSQGQVTEAIATLEPHARGGQGDPVATALLARAYLIAGRAADAASLLKAADSQQQGRVELLLVRAEVARVQGDEPAARSALQEVIRIEPNNPEAWYGIGRIETEREYVKSAREALERAITLEPNGAGYHGELGTVETFANEFPAADRAFRDALARHPDDYVALTGLGILQLKRGETEAALESFLKAGTIEPRYSRAWLFTGAAYYQLGEHARGVEAFRKAASLDDKDPLPWLMQSLAHFDALELGQAIETSREAQARMPNLKSVNQLANDQKGSANVGGALAAFGMEEWSQSYAYNSYNPYWAGSHLFLSDRFDGTFNRNSELYMGFLTDPSVFGASNRFSSIVAVPGRYGAVGAGVTRDYITEYGVSAAVNGYSVGGKPISYFIGGDITNGESEINRTDTEGRMRAQGENVVLGFGMRASHELNLFAFGNYSYYDGTLKDITNGLTNDKFSVDYRRADAGMNYKFSPTNQGWFKLGGGSEEIPVSGPLFSQDIADSLNAAFGTTIFQPGGTLNAFNTDVSQYDAQWRHTFDLNPRFQLSWGLEYSESKKPFLLDVVFAPVRIVLSQDNQLESGTAYVSGKFKLSGTMDGQLDLFYQDTRSKFVTDQTVQVGAGTPIALPREAGDTDHQELNPRIGVKWTPSAGQTVRVAGQIWRKPASVSTLAPVDTVGIPLDDRIERDGGQLKRARVQHEIEFSRETFFQWFADLKEVKNLSEPGSGIVGDLELDQLERLRNRRRVFGVRQEYLEETPEFSRGRIGQAGVAVNRLLSREMTLAARYYYTDSENTGTAFNGLDVPFHPRHYFSTSLNWQPYRRWVVGPIATYRSSRYTDEENTAKLTSGWSFGAYGYWESADKRWSVAGVLDQVTSSDQSSLYRDPVFTLQSVYRF
jgi:tetratricopeptide (TPR) repeat protein